jgi:hypothetical protein
MDAVEFDFVNRDDGWAIVEQDTGESPPEVLRTRNGGRAWSRV